MRRCLAGRSYTRDFKQQTKCSVLDLCRLSMANGATAACSFSTLRLRVCGCCVPLRPWIPATSNHGSSRPLSAGALSKTSRHPHARFVHQSALSMCVGAKLCAISQTLDVRRGIITALRQTPQQSICYKVSVTMCPYTVAYSPAFAPVNMQADVVQHRSAFVLCIACTQCAY